jgi:cell division protein FtsB
MRASTTARATARSSASGKKKPGKQSAKRPATHPASSGRPSRRAATLDWAVNTLGGIDRRRFTPAIAAVLAFGFVWTYYPVAKVQYQEVRAQVRLETELAALESRNSELQRDVDRLKTQEGVEDAARSSLGLVRKGERTGVVVDDSSETTLQAPPEISEVDVAALTPSGPWTAFLDAFFGVAQ